jgi:MYND finger
MSVEDGNGLEEKGGNEPYSKFLQKYRTDPNSCTRIIREIEQSATNYTRHWLGGSMKFHPLKYDVEFHQRVLDSMVDGPNCIIRSSCFEIVEVYKSCNNCGETLKPLMMCNACRQTFYCNRQCQKEDWIEGGHKEDCKK